MGEPDYSTPRDEQPLWERELWPDEPERRTPTNGSAGPSGATSAYAAAAFDSEVAVLATAPEGERNETLNACAFNLAQLVGGGELPRQPTWDALYGVAVRTGLTPTETTNTLTSAFEAGEAKPRSAPPRDTDPVEEATVFEPQQGEDQAGTVERLFPLVDFASIWDSSEDEDEWILEPIIPARRLVALYSPPKVGKSLLMLELAVGLSTGEEVLGVQPDRAHKVAYIDAENDVRGDIVNRLKAMGRKAEELDQLCYLSYPRLPALDTASGALQLLAVIEHYGCDVLVIDTVGRVVGGEENENDTWLNFYRHTGVALKRAGVTVIRLDHSGKDPAKGMRGGSAKYGDVDLVWSMTLVGEALRLECTDHRMVVPEPVLMIERDALPHLHHTVRLEGRDLARGREQDQLLAFLDSVAGHEEQLGVNEAMKLLRDHGRGKRKGYVSELIQARDLRFNARGLWSPKGGNQ